MSLCENEAKEYISQLESTINKLKMFIDHSDAGMYVADYETGEILYANRKMVALGGNDRNPEEIIGQTCWKFVNIGHDERCPFCPREQLIDENGNPLGVHKWEHFFKKFGFWLKIISQIIVWPDGRLAQMNTFYDITETKRLQYELAAVEREKEARRMQQNLQTVLDSLPVAIRIVSRDEDTVLYVNNACHVMFGYPSAEAMLGLKVTDMLPPRQSDGSDSKERLTNLLSNPATLTSEIEYLSPKGDIIYARVTACAIEYNGVMSSLSILTDLSAERARRRMLENAAEKEREANKLKSRFLSNMSHEIRTPMNAIIGLTEIELHKKNPDKTIDTYKKINLSAKSLLEIVNDILDLSKIEADRLSLFPEPFVLEDTLNNAMLVAAPRLEGKLVEFMSNISPDLPSCIIGDRTRLWQILKNYLDNAAKFTQAGSIVLSVFEDKERSTDETIYITFEVADTGIGMDDYQLSKVFDPYEQVLTDAQKHYTGTGLGLPLSKRICALMGGTMDVESHLGEGTTMRVTIPFGRVSETDERDMCDNVPDFSGLKVLIVDDSMLSLRIMGGVLKTSGALVFNARNAQEAVSMIKKHPDVDFILLDYLLGNDNGLSVAEKMSAEVATLPKIIIVTSYESDITRDEMEKCGIYDIIEKPFVPSQFLQKICEITGCGNKDICSSDDEYAMFENAKVLICEDNALNQVVAAGMLEQFGIAPVFANNGKRGIELLNQRNDFDLIFMDLQMPEMGGLEATRIIRSDHKYDGVPIVGLTADAMSEASEKCLAAGMNDYLSKPYVMEDFHAVLLKWISHRKVQ